MHREIQIPTTLESYTSLFRGKEAPENRLVGLSRLNIFVGPNNTGKSRLLRAIFDTDELRADGDDKASSDVRALVEGLRKVFEPHKGQDAVDKYLQKLDSHFPTLVTLDWRRKTGVNSQDLTLIDILHEDQTLLKLMVKTRRTPFHRQSQEYNSWVETLKRDQSVRADKTTKPPLRIYIPALRGLRPLGDEDVYQTRTIKDYFTYSAQRDKYTSSSLEEASIFTGLSVTKQLQAYLLGEPDQRSKIVEFQEFLSETFFERQPVTLMPKLKDDFLSIRVGQEERPIYELGDGVQQVIILTLPLFLHREKVMFLFIEEPELYLHPGFQRIFAETVLKHSGKAHQVFIATHSSQFLDITIDQSECSVFKVEKTPEQSFKVSTTSTGDFALLSSLGIRNSSVFLSNCTIWVEGITDRLYLKKFLELYQQQNKRTVYAEDLHFSFVEYSGNNITHWSFLDPEEGIDVSRLCGNAMVIADHDAHGKKKTRHEQLKTALGDRFVLLECREVENLLTPETIKRVLCEYEKDEALEFRSFTQGDYKSEALGEFIMTRVLQAPSTRRGVSPYAETSGTVKGKIDFCKKALRHIVTFDDMSDDAKHLAECIYRFIQSHNS